MADLSVAKPRVNASMLPRYQGKVVTIMGMAHDADQDGMGFQLKTSDDHDIHIKLNEMLQDYIEGLVEVQGIANGNEIQGLNFVQFSPEASQDFDMETYNKTITMISNNPQHYLQKDGFPETS